MGFLSGALRGVALVSIWETIKLVICLITLLKWMITGTSANARIVSDKGTEEIGSGNKTVVRHVFELQIPIDGAAITKTCKCSEQAADKIAAGNKVKVWYNKKKDQVAFQQDLISDFTGSLIVFTICAAVFAGLLIAILNINM